MFLQKTVIDLLRFGRLPGAFKKFAEQFDRPEGSGGFAAGRGAKRLQGRRLSTAQIIDQGNVKVLQGTGLLAVA